MRRYSKGASKDVERAMLERRRGTLRSSSGQMVTSRKQAIAIGLSEARREGLKVPSKAAKTPEKTVKKPTKAVKKPAKAARKPAKAAKTSTKAAKKPAKAAKKAVKRKPAKKRR